MTTSRVAADLDELVTGCSQALATGGTVFVVDPIGDVGVAGLAAVAATTGNVNFLIRECRGILYVGVDVQRLRTLHVSRQAGGHLMGAHVYVAVDAIRDVTTGVSAADRARTIRALADPATMPSDLRTPGHVLPATVDPSGDVTTFYFNEALQHLVSLTGLGPGIALSAVLSRAGAMASAAEVRQLAAERGMPVITIPEVLRARRRQDGWPTPWDGWRTVTLVHHGVELAIRATDAHRLHHRYPVAVLPWCTRGHLLRLPCRCRDLFDAAVGSIDGSIDGSGSGAVVLCRSADRRNAGDAGEAVRPTCPLDGALPAGPGLAGVPGASGLSALIAADLAGSLPGPLGGADRSHLGGTADDHRSARDRRREGVEV